MPDEQYTEENLFSSVLSIYLKECQLLMSQFFED